MLKGHVSLWMEACDGKSSHHARFGGNWSSVSGDVTYLMCQINSQDHMNHRIMWLYGWEIATVFLQPPRQVFIDIVVVEICFNIYLVISKLNVIKRSSVYRWEPLMISHHFAKLVAVGILLVKICFQWLKCKIPHARSTPSLLFFSEVHDM